MITQAINARAREIIGSIAPADHRGSRAMSNPASDPIAVLIITVHYGAHLSIILGIILTIIAAWKRRKWLAYVGGVFVFVGAYILAFSNAINGRLPPPF